MTLELEKTYAKILNKMRVHILLQEVEHKIMGPHTPQDYVATKDGVDYRMKKILNEQDMKCNFTKCKSLLEEALKIEDYFKQTIVLLENIQSLRDFLTTETFDNSSTSVLHKSLSKELEDLFTKEQEHTKAVSLKSNLDNALKDIVTAIADTLDSVYSQKEQLIEECKLAGITTEVTEQ